MRSSSGVITVISTNNVSDSPADSPISNYRWEPSSTSASTWLSSWHDVGTTIGASPPQSVTHSYTSVWSSGAWSARLEHRTPAGSQGNAPLMDTYTYWDAYRGLWALTGIDYGVVGNSAWVQYSSSSSGLTWQAMSQALVGTPSGPVNWDFPSAAVNTSNGRIVVGATEYCCGNLTTPVGYYSAWSTDGVHWNGPYQVRPYTVNGLTGGGSSRIVWSASGFHAFIRGLNQNATTFTLEHWTSPDGQTWTKQSPIATYGVPLASSSTEVVSGPGGPGYLSYAFSPDAVSSPGLGYVVAYPVNVSGRNGINVSTELGGGVTIDYTQDLFSHGIATSASGDWYLTYQTYQNPGQSPILLQEGVVYRTPGSPSYVGATVEQNIDPSKWFFYSSTNRCQQGDFCYTSGDWFRPTMNTYAAASVPVIMGSGNTNDLFQLFVADPQTSNVPQFLPHIAPFVAGSDISSQAVITAEHIMAGAASQGPLDDDDAAPKHPRAKPTKAHPKQKGNK